MATLPPCHRRSDEVPHPWGEFGRTVGCRWVKSIGCFVKGYDTRSEVQKALMRIQLLGVFFEEEEE